MNSTHSVEIVSDFIRGGWQATCRCGWRGRETPNADEARAEGTAHYTTEDR